MFAVVLVVFGGGALAWYFFIYPSQLAAAQSKTSRDADSATENPISGIELHAISKKQKQQNAAQPAVAQSETSRDAESATENPILGIELHAISQEQKQQNATQMHNDL